MSVPVPRKYCCDFCSRELAEVDLLFVSELGGIPPEICDRCVTGFAEVVTTHKRSPELAAAMVRALNDSIAQERREAGER